MNVQQQSARLRPYRPVPFGRYTLLTPLSMGGMGEIFLARLDGAQGFEKLCVIKKILPAFAQDTQFVERFVNEARVLVKLSHGSIAQVLDVGLFEGDPYIALEYVDGKDLRKVAARARDRGAALPLSFALYVAGRVLDALAYAHRKRDEEERELHLVHRDISPQNILISYEGEVKVIDFGLAKSSLSASLTHPSMILGKFLYMSPEQARHQKVDRRADLYAVGLCLYELVCGRNPFDDGSTAELMQRVINPSIAPLESVVADVPRPVREMVARALEIDPEKRFQSAEEFRGRVQACLMELDPAAGPENVSRFMLEAFAADYQQERRLLASLRNTPTFFQERAPREVATAVVAVQDVAPSRQAARTLLEVPAPPRASGVPAVASIQPVPLSFEPTPRIREGNANFPNERETVIGGPLDSPSRRETVDALRVVDEPTWETTPWSSPEVATVEVELPDEDVQLGDSGEPEARTRADDTQPSVIVASLLAERSVRERFPSGGLRAAAWGAVGLVVCAIAWTLWALMSPPGDARPLVASPASARVAPVAAMSREVASTPVAPAAAAAPSPEPEPADPASR